MKLVVTEHAWSSLADLTDYWSSFRSFDRIDEQVTELWEVVDWLLENPTAGQFEDQLQELGLGHRRWVFGDLKIVYRLVGKQFIITDFFDSRQDPRRMKA